MYPECDVRYPLLIGNGACNFNLEEYNTAACEWDGGDCIENNKYPKCRIDDDCMWSFDNGRCDEKYNSAEYGWDGGDCA